MKPAPFAYAKARTLDDAIRLLGEHKGDAKLLAGGQSLIATLNMRLSSPSLLVDINGIGLDGVSVKDGVVEIGALARHVTLERSSDIAKHAPLIALAMPHVAHPAIRNRGTIGGSLAYADPAAELPACLVALDGEVDVTGPNGKRAVKAADFFKGLFETALGAHDVLSAIRFPAAAADTRVGFAELARRHGDYALVGLAAVAKAKGKSLSDIRLVYFGVGALPVRAHKAEAALAAGAVDEAVKMLDLDPSDDLHASGTVKKHLAGVLLRRVAEQLAEPRA
ncbi:MAG: xanthine dehydrogenase family protein subunit M [Alphaproteobacteria bacterium]